MILKLEYLGFKSKLRGRFIHFSTQNLICWMILPCRKMIEAYEASYGHFFTYKSWMHFFWDTLYDSLIFLRIFNIFIWVKYLNFVNITNITYITYIQGIWNIEKLITLPKIPTYGEYHIFKFWKHYQHYQHYLHYLHTGCVWFFKFLRIFNIFILGVWNIKIL